MHHGVFLTRHLHKKMIVERYCLFGKLLKNLKQIKRKNLLVIKQFKHGEYIEIN